MSTLTFEDCSNVIPFRRPVSPTVVFDSRHETKFLVRSHCVALNLSAQQTADCIGQALAALRKGRGQDAAVAIGQAQAGKISQQLTDAAL